jgi:C-terminal processing protease CtpA/Prc
MTIRGFGGGNTEEEAQKKMRDFLNDCMKKLQAKKTENLIIDLRYNSGGWDIQGVELLTFLAKEPFKVYQKLHSITDSSEYLKFSDLSKEDLKNVKKELKPEADGTFSVKEEFSLQLKLQNPQPNRFAGKVYFLINGRSASTTAEFTAAAHTQKIGLMIGEESGGAYEGGNGGSFLHFELPHSKIKIGSPLLYYDNAVNPPAQKGRGTLPDYEVPNNYNDLFKGIDTQLNFILELIRKNR